MKADSSRSQLRFLPATAKEDCYLSNDAFADRVEDQLRNTVNIQFLHQVSTMGIHRMGADSQ